MPPDAGLVLAAAGSGLRASAGGSAPKQFRPVAGVPVLARALQPFLDLADVASIAVALPAAVVAAPPDWLARLAGPRVQLVVGGATRGASVRAGLSALPLACEVILVHDAARPFPDREVILAVLHEARAGRGAVAAVRVTDTLKETIGDGGGSDLPRVVGTVSRERLWRAQTPQGFPRRLLEAAHAKAAEEGIDATDDAGLVERLGATVVVVPDTSRNLKVTTAEDFLVAEALAGRPA